MKISASIQCGIYFRRVKPSGFCHAFAALSLLLLAANSTLQADPAAASPAPVKRWNDISYYVASWQTDHGLPQNSIITIQQTRDGYLWMGTFNGLVRFDGTRFTVYNNHTTPELGSSRVLQLHEGPSGYLWIATESGSLVRMKGGKFSPVEFGRQTSRPLIIAMAEDRSGRLWFTTADGKLHVYEQGSVKSANHGINEDWCKSVFNDHRGELSLLTMNGIHRFNEVKQQFEFLPATSDLLQNSLIVIPSRSGGYFAASGGRISKFNANGLERDLGPIPFNKSGLTLLFEDSKGNLWAGSYGSGLVRFRPDGSTSMITEEDGLSHEAIRTMFEDLEGNLWVGTDGGGLNRLTENKFDVLDRQSGLSENVVLSVAEDKEGGLWIGTNGGALDYFKDGRIKNFGPEQGLVSGHVWSVLCDSQNRIWAGTWGAGLFRLEDGVFKTLPEIPPALASVVLALFEDRKGRIWIGTQSGLVKYEDGVATRFTVLDGLPNNDIRAIKEDLAGNIWIGSNGGGLIKFDGSQFTVWGARDGLVNDSVWSLHLDNQNAIWIGTFGGGLSRFYDGSFQTFNSGNGLEGNVICHIAEDALGNLWISSYTGLFRVEKEVVAETRNSGSRFTSMAYDKGDGLPSREFTGGFQPAGIKTSDGSILFPTIRGLVKVNPAKLENASPIPSLALEDIFIDDQRIDLGSLVKGSARGQHNHIAVSPGRERIEIHYTALSFTAPGKTRFQYRLTGLENQWVDAGSRRVAYYTHLPSGNYTFELRAANRDGTWSRDHAFLSMTVYPPFWRTWWFLALVAMVGGGLITGIMRYVEITRLKRKMQRLEQQHAIEKERSRIAKDIHDDVGASLTQITLLSELARSDLNRPQQAEEHIRQISSTAREVTRCMDEIVWAVNPHNDTLEDLISYTTKSAHDYLQIARIRFRLDLPAQLPPVSLTTEIRHNVFLVVREALNNIVKHAHATEVWLRVTLEPTAFTVTVEDNGLGMAMTQAASHSPPERIAHGNGLRNMRKRIEEIEGDFWVRPLEAGGTQVGLRVLFPASLEEERSLSQLARTHHE